MTAMSRRKGANGEEWRDVPIPEFSGRYQVSDRGRVRAHPDVRQPGARPGRIIFQSVDTKGYPQVSMYRAPLRRTVKVHRLVADAFLGCRPAGFQVNHIDGVKFNNALVNLEYVSNVENAWHAHRVIGGRAFVLVRGERMCISEAISRYGAPGLSGKAVRRRIVRLGWPVDVALSTPIQSTGRPSGGRIFP
jgi:hypothetical protein